MKKGQYIVQETNNEERKAFYNYIIYTYNLKDFINKKELLETKFPFVVDFDEDIFWICNSITCCACAAQNNKIIDIPKFKALVRK